MIKPTLFVPLAACLLAMACAQAIAAPNPYSNFVVFGDSLSDAGTSLPTRAVRPDATQRFTNRTGPVYFDGSGEVCSLNSTQLLGGRLGFAPDQTDCLDLGRCAPARACRTATTGRSAAIAPTRSSIRSPTSTRATGRTHLVAGYLAVEQLARRPECAVFPLRWR